MAVRLKRLLGRADLLNPSAEHVLAQVEHGVSFALEVDDGMVTGSFHGEANGPLWHVQVEGLGDRDQFALTDPSRVGPMTRFVTDHGDVYHYAAFCLVKRELVEKALRYFVRDGKRDPSLQWMSASQLLEGGHVEFE